MHPQQLADDTKLSFVIDGTHFRDRWAAESLGSFPQSLLGAPCFQWSDPHHASAGALADHAGSLHPDIRDLALLGCQIVQCLSCWGIALQMATSTSHFPGTEAGRCCNGLAAADKLPCPWCPQPWCATRALGCVNWLANSYWNEMSFHVKFPLTMNLQPASNFICHLSEIT